MNNSVLLCDSNGEVWHTEADKLHLNYISMPYTLDNKEYFYDLGKETDFASFYGAIRKGSVPITSALNPHNYTEILEPYYKEGKDVLYISFSHAMSGTFNQLEKSINELKKTYPNRKTTVFNTNSISMGAGLQMMEAAKLKNSGKSDKEIVAHLKKFTDRVAVIFMVNDLMHLKRGGRLSAAQAFAGSMLSLKPIITLDENGSLKVVRKIIGKRKVLAEMAQKVVEDLDDENYDVYVMHADCEKDGQTLVDKIKEGRPNATVNLQMVGPVIGSHCGPGTIGVIYVAKQRPIPLAK